MKLANGDYYLALRIREYGKPVKHPKPQIVLVWWYTEKNCPYDGDAREKHIACYKQHCVYEFGNVLAEDKDDFKFVHHFDKAALKAMAALEETK